MMTLPNAVATGDMEPIVSLRPPSPAIDAMKSSGFLPGSPISPFALAGEAVKAH
jgi:phosphate starvation-inducible protein PhoH